MALRVVGAGLGRTGTHSLKIALEQLLGGPCYHMVEVFSRPEHVPQWHSAALGEPVDWHGLMDGFTAAVDWPASAYWRELSDANPEAIIVLSSRPSEAWWKSASSTIFPGIAEMNKPETQQWHDMVMTMMRTRFKGDIHDKESSIAAFERHNSDVKRTAPADRLVVWQASDGWGPLCKALNVPVPDEPFPLTNTTEEFQSRHRS